MIVIPVRHCAPRRGRPAAIALVFSLICASAWAQDTPATPEQGSAPASIKLVGVIAGMPAGAPWLTISHGLLCIGGRTTQAWSGGREPQPLPPYAVSFKNELEGHGYKVVTPGDNLFDPEGGAADYEAAAVIKDEHIDGCVSDGGLLNFSNLGDVRGSGEMEIDWQIYSPIKKEVLAHIITMASAKLDNSVPGGLPRLQVESFAANVRELARSNELRTALNAAKPLTKGFVMPGQQARIALAGSLKAKGQPIADAVGSVVTLTTGAGTGSGVLISNDGYLLTNAHVVGDEKTLRVRWSDNIETLGEVVRVAKDRDVALIKTNPRERMPLAIKRGIVTPGQKVYAIGSPAGPKYQGTVTSGVISTTRILDGLRYIQSDVMVSFGSSGGALLDESGSLIGLTDLGISNHGENAGLNMFIPISDAMDFLALDQQ